MGLDRVDAEEDLVSYLLVGRREWRSADSASGRRARPAPCAGFPSAHRWRSAGGPSVDRTRSPGRGSRCGGAEAEPVAVAKASPSRNPLAVDQGPVAGEALVDQAPVALDLLDLGVKPRHLPVPVERDVVVVAPADRDPPPASTSWIPCRPPDRGRRGTGRRAAPPRSAPSAPRRRSCGRHAPFRLRGAAGAGLGQGGGGAHGFGSAAAGTCRRRCSSRVINRRSGVADGRHHQDRRKQPEDEPGGEGAERLRG